MMNLPSEFNPKFKQTLIYLWLLLAGLLNVGLLSAQQPASSKTVSLLMMRSGRIVSGQIGEGAGGYLVKNPSGSMVVP